MCNTRLTTPPTASLCPMLILQSLALGQIRPFWLLGEDWPLCSIQEEEGRPMGLQKTPNPQIAHPVHPKLEEAMQVGGQVCHLELPHHSCPPVPSGSGS